MVKEDSSPRPGPKLRATCSECGSQSVQLKTSLDGRVVCKNGKNCLERSMLKDPQWEKV